MSAESASRDQARQTRFMVAAVVALCAVLVGFVILRPWFRGPTPSVEESESFVGELVLTEAEPSAELAFTLTLDGRDAIEAWPIDIEIEVVSYGTTSDPEQAVAAQAQMGAAGVGVVGFELVDEAAAPVHVRWTVTARTYRTLPTDLFDRATPAQIPVLKVSSPDRPFEGIPGQDGAAFRLETVGFVDWDQPVATRISLSSTTDGPLTVTAPVAQDALFDEGSLQFVVNDVEPVIVAPGAVGSLPRPARCGQGLCRYDVVVIANSPGSQPFEIRGQTGTELQGVEAIDLAPSETLIQSSPDLAPYLQGTTPLEPSLLKVNLETTSTSGAGIVSMRRRIPRDLTFEMGAVSTAPFFLAECCPRVEFWGTPEPPRLGADHRITFEVTVWAVEPTSIRAATLGPG